MIIKQKTGFEGDNFEDILIKLENSQKFILIIDNFENADFNTSIFIEYFVNKSLNSKALLISSSKIQFDKKNRLEIFEIKIDNFSFEETEKYLDKVINRHQKNKLTKKEKMFIFNNSAGNPEILNSFIINFISEENTDISLILKNALMDFCNKIISKKEYKKNYKLLSFLSIFRKPVEIENLISDFDKNDLDLLLKNFIVTVTDISFFSLNPVLQIMFKHSLKKDELIKNHTGAGEYYKKNIEKNPENGFEAFYHFEQAEKYEKAIDFTLEFFEFVLNNNHGIDKIVPLIDKSINFDLLYRKDELIIKKIKILGFFQKHYEASSLLERLPEKNANYYYLKALININSGYPDKSIEFFNKYREIETDLKKKNSTDFFYAYCNLLAGKTRFAKKFCEEKIEKAKTDNTIDLKNIYMALGLVYSTMANYELAMLNLDKSRLLWEKINQNEKIANLFFLKIIMLTNSGLFNDVFKTLGNMKKCYRKINILSKVKWYRLTVLFNYSLYKKNACRAEKFLQGLFVLSQGRTSLDKASYYFFEGEYYYFINEFSKSISSFDKAILITSTHYYSVFVNSNIMTSYNLVLLRKFSQAEKILLNIKDRVFEADMTISSAKLCFLLGFINEKNNIILDEYKEKEKFYINKLNPTSKLRYIKQKEEFLEKFNKLKITPNINIITSSEKLTLKENDIISKDFNYKKYYFYVDFDNNQAFLKGKEIPIFKRKVLSKLLKNLLLNPEELKTDSFLFENTWGRNLETRSDSILLRVSIHKLKEFFGQDLITYIPSKKGYMFSLKKNWCIKYFS